MFDFETWTIFLTASLALAFAPGPGMLYVLSRTIAGGKSVGVASTLGAACGGFFHVIAAAIGVSALLAASPIAFTIVKYLGAVFLVYLGVKMVASAFNDYGLDHSQPNATKGNELKNAFSQGIISEILNPKTAVFFLAFIPQFIAPSQGYVFFQFFLLGVIVVLLNTIPDFIIVFFSKPIEKLWKSSNRFRIIQKIISGIILVALGVYLALASPSKGISASA